MPQSPSVRFIHVDFLIEQLEQGAKWISRHNRSLQIHTVSIFKKKLSLLHKCNVPLLSCCSHLLPREAFWIYSLAFSFEFTFIPLPASLWFPLTPITHLKGLLPGSSLNSYLSFAPSQSLFYLTTFQHSVLIMMLFSLNQLFCRFPLLFILSKKPAAITGLYNRAAITKYHKICGLNKKKIFFQSSGG